MAGALKPKSLQTWVQMLMMLATAFEMDRDCGDFMFYFVTRSLFHVKCTTVYKNCIGRVQTLSFKQSEHLQLFTKVPQKLFTAYKYFNNDNNNKDFIEQGITGDHQYDAPWHLEEKKGELNIFLSVGSRDTWGYICPSIFSTWFTGSSWDNIFNVKVSITLNMNE